MPTDKSSERKVICPEPENHGSKFVAIFIILVAVMIGEIYSLSKMHSMRTALEARQDQLHKALNDQVAALEETDARQLDALRAELDRTAERMGSTGKDLNRARALVTRLQKQEQQEASELKQEIAKKADEEKVGALSLDVSATKNDLSSTRETVDQLAKDYGMSKSEFGTLIARNHDDIEALRKLGERDYFEFTLTKNQKQQVAGVGLTLKRTNTKHNRFDLTMIADDMQVDKKGKTVNEPVFFYVAGSKVPYELVVNKVESSQVKGYISTPKGATEQLTAERGSNNH